jgi:raffinose/stachyose/melibiose transport system substrate-binding protein
MSTGRKLAALLVALGLVVVSVLVAAASAQTKTTTITIESWRSDDASIWNSKIIPAFEKAHPDIKVQFAPTAPTEYNAALSARLKGGTAGDLVTCRPFDESLKLYQEGYLTSLNSLTGMSNFSNVAKSAWQTDDGKTTFCVPMASVLHGFIYNKDAFAKLHLAVPKTEAQFYSDLAKIKSDGTYTPLAIGTHDQWEAATMGWENIGPNFWQGEKGRLAVINGTLKLTAKPFVETFADLAKWRPYMPKGASSVQYADSQNLFTSGRAAIYPAGSWEIPGFESKAKFKMGAFKPPLPTGQKTCYISDQNDHALGLNAKSKNADAAKTFLQWVASPAFAVVYQNALPGFFAMQKKSVAMNDALGKQFLSWRNTCKSTIRLSYQILSRGNPNLENELWLTSANVMNGKMTPQAAAARLQKGLSKWYHPKKK